MNMRKNFYNTKLKAAVFIIPILLGCASLIKANTYLVTNTQVDGIGSFRHALQLANAHAGADKIAFSLPMSNTPYVIKTGRETINISDNVTIDAWDNDFANVPFVSNLAEKPIKIYLDTEGDIVTNNNATFRGVGLVQNNMLVVPEGNFKDNDPKTGGICLDALTKDSKANGFNFNSLFQKTIRQLLKNKKYSQNNVIKFYPDTVQNLGGTTRIIYKIAPLVDTVPNGAACVGGQSNVLSLIVSENATIVTQPTDITECIGGTLPLTIVTKGGTGNISYQWQQSANGINWTDISGANGLSYTPPSTAAGTMNYHVVITSDIGNCGAVTSDAATAIVVSDPSVLVAASKLILCEGETTILKATVSGGSGTATFQWQSSLDGATWTDISGATAASYTAASLTVTTRFRLIVKQIAGCEVISNPTLITVGACNGVIGDFVWLDCNKNGIQDAGEIGIDGVPVNLSGTSLGGDIINENTTTNGSGQYRFTSVKPGSYTVTFGTPPITGLAFTGQRKGGDAVDSDVDGSGKTDVFNFTNNQVTTTIDAGFIDVAAPIFITPPTDLVVQCDSKGNNSEIQEWLNTYGKATAKDNIAKSLTWTNNYKGVTTSCGATGAATVIFTVTDECGNSSTATAKVTIKDDLPPVFTSRPIKIALKCGEAIPPPSTPSVSDECDANVKVVMTETKELLCGLGFRITRVWTATDACGNSSTAAQTLESNDDLAPVLSNVPSNVTISCKDPLPLGNTVIATDNCDLKPRVTMSDLVTRGICPGNYTINRLWTAADDCGNFATATQVIVVGDFDVPVLTGVPADITVDCANLVPSSNNPNVKATDLCSATVKITVSDKVSRGACTNSYSVIRTWTATDPCGNAAQKQQKITVDDKKGPTFAGIPSDVTVNLYKGEKVPVAPRVTATDNCDSRLTITYAEVKTVNLCGYVLKRTWAVADNCTNRTEKTQTITVNAAENLAKTLSVVNENCGDRNGRIEMTPNTLGYNYKWADGSTGYLRTNLTAGTYKVSVTSSGSCTKVVEVTIQRDCNCDKPVVSIDKQDATCATPDFGFATVNVANGLVGDFRYIFTPSVSTTNKATNLAPGTYKVRVERFSNANCFTEVDFTINAVSFVQILDPSVIPTTCNTKVGKVTFTVPVGDSLTFNWADGNTQAARTALGAGTYAVTISRPNSSACPLVKNVVVPSDNALGATYVVNRQPSCNLPNGAVTITTTGGSGNYIYSWGEGNSRYVLLAGPLNVTVTDVATGCTTVVSFVLVNQAPAATVFMDSITQGTCAGSSDARMSYRLTLSTGFTLPAKVEIRNLNNVLATNGALAAGSYNLIVKDSIGCSAIQKPFKVIEPAAIVVTPVKANQTCDALGSINLNVVGGNGNFRYTWADVPTNTSYRDNLKAGTYSVTVFDAAGCQRVVKNIAIVDSCLCRLPVVDSISVVQANCGVKNGSATIILRGGNEANYTYSWSALSGRSNAIGNNFTDLGAGIYTVTVTAKNNTNCTTILSVGIGGIEGPQGISTVVSPAVCDLANGSVTLNSASQPTYTWLFDGKILASRNDLKAGTYQVQAANPSNPACVSMITVRVPSQSNLTTMPIITQQPSCGKTDGIAAVRAIGGSGNYRYSWGVDSIRRDLKSGVYAVTVTDLTSNCKAISTFTLFDNNVAAANISISNAIVNLSCAGNRDGKVNYTVTYATGFAQLAQVQIVDGLGIVYANGSLPVGNYCIVIKDATGCVAGSKCFEVKQPTAILATVSKINKTCSTGGSITLGNISGGSGSYLYGWSDQNAYTTTPSRTGLEAGTYGATVYDSKGCTFVFDTILVKNDCPTQTSCSTFSATAAASDKTCTEGGKILITVKNGTTPTNFDWSDLAGTSNAQNRFYLLAGTYSVTVTDGTGCSQTINNIVLKDACPNVLTNCTAPVLGGITVVDATCGKANGQATVSVLSPTNVVYKWTPTVTSLLNVASNMAANVYKVKVCVANDTTCFTEKDVVVKNADGIPIGQPSITGATCSSSNGKVTYPSVGTPLNFVWSDGKGGSSRSDLAKGTYFVTITDPLGVMCKQIVSVDVPVINSLAAAVTVDRKADCGLSNGQATVKVAGTTGSGSYSYSWGASATRTDLGAGIFPITVTDNQTGCQALTNLTMTENAVGFATVSITNPIVYLSCAGEKNGTAVYNVTYLSGFAQPSKVLIKDNLNKIAANDSLSVGRYGIFVYDKNNCLAGVGSFEVREPQLLSVSSSAIAQTCTAKGAISITTTGGSGVYTFQWSDLTGANQPQNRTDLTAAKYTVTVTDSRGCNRILDATVDNQATNCAGACTLSATAAPLPKTCTEGGKITLTITNGSGTYDFKWSDLTALAQPQNRTGLNPGSYSVTMTDLTTNCSFKVLNIVIQNQAIGCPKICNIIANTEVQAKNCTTGGNIRIISITGGATPYTFDWLDLTGTTNPQNRLNIATGKYTVIITDSLNCKDTLQNIAILDSCVNNCPPPVIGSVNVTDATCSNKNGAISIAVVGTGYSYSWMPNVSTTNSATGLMAGIYKVRIAKTTDPTCYLDKDIVVNNVNSSITLGNPTIKDASCGASNGSATINGQATWVYTWNDGVKGATRNSLGAATYYVSVTDPSVSACPVVQTIVIKSTNSLTASVVINKKSTCGASNGQATITVLGGSGSYLYSWGSTNVVSNLKSGSYNVTVSDNQTGCNTVVLVNVSDTVAANATISNSTPTVNLKCRGDQNGSAVFTVTYNSGFAQPAVVKVLDANNAVVLNGNLKAGKYKIVVTDANGCTAGMTNFDVVDPQPIVAQTSIVPADCTLKGAISLTVVGGTSPYTFDWADQNGTNNPQNRTGLDKGNFSVTITDANGCSSAVNNIAVTTLCRSIYPKRDTVTRDIIVGRTDTVCAPYESALAGQILSYTFCGGNTAASMAFGSVSLNTIGCISYKAGFNIGRDEICVRGCNTSGVCDTTIMFVNVIANPVGCLPSYSGATTLGIARCDSFAMACTNIPYRQLNNFTLNVDGLPAQLSSTGCKQDTVYAYSYATLTRFYPTGPWDMTSWTVNGKVFAAKIASISVLVDSMNRWDATGNWSLDAPNQTIFGGDIRKSYDSMTWKKANRSIATFKVNRQIVPAQMSVKLMVGNHRIIFTDKIKGCRDTANITVVCNASPATPRSYRIDTLILVNQRNTICLTNSNWASQTVIRNVCVGSYKGYVGYNINDNTDCISLVGVALGRDTLCLRRCYSNGQCDTVTMIIAVKTSATASDSTCIKAYVGSNYYNVTCGTQAQLCTTLQGSDTLNYAISDNGTAYKNGYSACATDTSYAYSYYSLILTSPTGPWKLDNWVVNGRSYSGIIPNIRALVDSMNRWDVGGNWSLQSANYTIKGGKSGSYYGNMAWSKNGYNVATFSTNIQTSIRQIGLRLDVGSHTVIFRNILRGCNDTAIVTVDCRVLRTRPSIMKIDTFVYVNESSKICLPINGLVPSTTKIVPLRSVKGYVTYSIDDKTDCITVNGANVGKDTILLQRCDFDSECDTIRIAVNIYKRQITTTETVSKYVLLNADSTYCVNTSELLGNKITLKNACEPNSTNNVNFIVTGTCVRFMADNVGVDTACLVACDAYGNCDTTKLVVYVTNNLNKLPTPVAVNDRGLTNRTTEISMSPMINDSLFGLQGNIFLLTQPNNGSVTFDAATKKVTYKSFVTGDCVARDSFRYALVTDGGKDTAWVNVEVLCDEIVVFSGFSPNNDGVNDYFTIIGLDKYPSSKVLVFNRAGNQVFTADNYQNDWDATTDGRAVADGTYFWVIDLGNGRKLSGYVQIHR